MPTLVPALRAIPPAVVAHPTGVASAPRPSPERYPQGSADEGSPSPRYDRSLSRLLASKTPPSLAALAAPPDIRPDLAERFRQLEPFDHAERLLVQALVNKPNQLERRHEITLRIALNLARLWIIHSRGQDLAVGPFLGSFRERVRRLAATLQPSLDPQTLGSDAVQLHPHLTEAQDKLLARHVGRLSREELDRELRSKALVLALGGGGGTGFVHLGTFSLLEELGVRPRLVAGTSIGAILGAFRARELGYEDDTFEKVSNSLSFKKMFGVLDSGTRYAMPGALRLHLRTALSSFFLNEVGETKRLDELEIPFITQVTGVRRDAARGIARYEKIFRQELRSGAIGRLLHVRDLVGHGVKFITELAGTPGALKPIVLGSDRGTEAFDALDAAGFSAALPALIQYDITRPDARMHRMIELVLRRSAVDFLADGGMIANVPARAAWEYVQSGRLRTRNACIVGLDCFAPTFGRHILFLPLQRIAAETVARNRPFSQLMFTYRRTLSPTVLVPSVKAVQTAVRNGRREFSRVAGLLLKFVEPLTEHPQSVPTPQS